MSELIMTEEAGTPSTPGSSKWKLYPKSDGWYALDDAGLEIGPLAVGGSSDPAVGTMSNGKLSVTVVSNDLIVALKTLAGADPSAGDPVLANINGVIYSIEAALNQFIPSGMNWFNAGAAETATLLVPYFVYLVDDSGTPALTVARKSHYRVVASDMSTTTSDTHIYGYSGFTDGDEMMNIGYFEATLSAGAGYTWTVPTFTSDNLRHQPTHSSRWMTWTPVITGYSANPTGEAYLYRVYGESQYEVDMLEDTPGTSNLTTKTYTLPFIATAKTYIILASPQDNGTQKAAGLLRCNSGLNTADAFLSAFGGWTNTGNARILRAKGFIRM